MKANRDQVVAVHAVALTLYNCRPSAVIEQLFPGSHPNYIAEWCERWLEGFTAFWGHLDVEHQQRFVEIAIEKYGDDSSKRLDLVTEFDSKFGR